MLLERKFLEGVKPEDLFFMEHFRECGMTNSQRQMMFWERLNTEAIFIGGVDYIRVSGGINGRDCIILKRAGVEKMIHSLQNTKKARAKGVLLSIKILQDTLDRKKWDEYPQFIREMLVHYGVNEMVFFLKAHIKRHELTKRYMKLYPQPEKKLCAFTEFLKNENCLLKKTRVTLKLELKRSERNKNALKAFYEKEVLKPKYDPIVKKFIYLLRQRIGKEEAEDYLEMLYRSSESSWDRARAEMFCES